ncbi:hypothetical phage protein [Corynebacterium resistens DSM 45100]|uniref:Hypothetical phage protein n=1 Tax=Corynebacterium resistens (strain DSM 45100 / JCM 12819 / GTC 2026 / SICGH 158) TaxID=662755 RepID=F8E170_CORRG|nr:hypothetical phage protein [Corynebacterium resistens DSM 45100]
MRGSTTFAPAVRTSSAAVSSRREVASSASMYLLGSRIWTRAMMGSFRLQTVGKDLDVAADGLDGVDDVAAIGSGDVHDLRDGEPGDGADAE